MMTKPANQPRYWVNQRVRHAYTGMAEGTVTRVFATRNGFGRITVAWDDGKSATHDMSLIRLAGEQEA